MSVGRVLYNGASGTPTTSAELRFDDSTKFPDSRLDTINVHVDENVIVNGQVGISTANPRKELEVSGYTILEGQGSDSEANNEFGLNGSYDTLSIMSQNGIGTNGRMSVFFGLASVVNYPVARIVAGDVYGRTTLAFQTGFNQSLVERMRIDTNGYIGIGTSSPNYMLDVHGMAHITNNVFLNGQSILYRNYTIPTPATGNLYLNFPNVGSTSTTIDIELSMANTASPNDSTMSKFTAFLSGYKGTGTGLYLNNISVQKNGNAFFGPYTINTNTYDPSGLSIQIDYVNSPLTAAINYTAYGPGAYKITEIHVTPIALVAALPSASVPGPPTNVQATGSPGQASVSWSAPSNNGGSDILGYTVSWSGGNKSLIGTSTIVTGLSNGTTYTFTVVAVNSVGNSSGASSTITIATVPTAPLNASATPGVRQATLSWQTPSTNGGAAITGYTVTYNGNTINVGNNLTTTVTGLTNGVGYNFIIYAVNGVGNSAPANTSTTTLDVPSVPTGLSASRGNRSVSLSWNPSSSNGGSVTYYISWAGGSSSTTATSYTVNGLTNGTTYTFTIYAGNNVGNSGTANISESPAVSNYFSVSVENRGSYESRLVYDTYTSYHSGAQTREYYIYSIDSGDAVIYTNYNESYPNNTTYYEVYVNYYNDTNVLISPNNTSTTVSISILRSNGRDPTNYYLPISFYVKLRVDGVGVIHTSDTFNTGFSVSRGQYDGT